MVGNEGFGKLRRQTREYICDEGRAHHTECPQKRLHVDLILAEIRRT